MGERNRARRSALPDSVYEANHRSNTSRAAVIGARADAFRYANVDSRSFFKRVYVRSTWSNNIAGSARSSRLCHPLIGFGPGFPRPLFPKKQTKTRGQT